MLVDVPIVLSRGITWFDFLSLTHSLTLIGLLFVHLLFAVLQHSIRREFLYFFPLSFRDVMVRARTHTQWC